MDTIIRVGLASYGMSGQVFHAPLLHVHKGFQLRSILERSSNKSKNRYPDVEIIKDYHKLIHDPEIDLIVVNTPDHLHYPMAMEALQAHKHVVIEKPFALHSDDGKKLQKMANENGLMISVYHNRRWDGGFLTLQHILKQGILGRIVEYEAHFDRYRNYIVDNWKENPDIGTENIFNLGSHLIDQALVLFGKPNSIFADIRAQRENAKVNDAFDLRLYYKDMRVLLKSTYLAKEAGPAYCVHGTEGSYIKYSADPQEEMLKAGRYPDEPGWGKEESTAWGIINYQQAGNSIREKIETIPGNYLSYYNSIYEHLVHNVPLAVSSNQANDVIRIIELALQSSAQGRVLPF
jgi:scyllo-inositol 2-dehydrogenase (NADP+)